MSGWFPSRPYCWGGCGEANSWCPSPGMLLRVSAGRGRPPPWRQLATSTCRLPTCQVGQQLLQLRYLLLADGPHRFQLVQNNRIAQDSKML